MKKKAIGLLSGGLDSSIAIKIMHDMGFEVVALNFKSPFCTCTSKNSGCQSEAVKISKQFNISIKTLFMGKDYIELIAKPKYGYGRNLNPCLDCRILMFKKAKDIMIEEDASFIFTGEVLGQRPMSQRRDSMRIIERDSGLDGLILRPLSAKLFPPTKAELEGVVDRKKMLDFSGRSRKPQIELAQSLGIHDYPCPAGGCLLTEVGFSRKMKDLIKDDKIPTLNAVKLLRFGRHFRINDKVKVIIGRDQKENSFIEKSANENDILLDVEKYEGPTGLILGDIEEKDIAIVAQIVVRYSDAPPNINVNVKVRKKVDLTVNDVSVQAINGEILDEMRI